jgi:hypothetical protein
MAAAERAAALAPTIELKNAILKEALAWKQTTIQQANDDMKRDLTEQNDQINFENSLIGKNTIEREKANVIRAQEIKIKEYARQGIPIDLANLKAETDALLKNIDAHGAFTKASSDADRFATSMRDVADSVRQATEGFGELFGTAGEGFSNLINTMFDYQSTQADIAADQAKNMEEYQNNGKSQLDFEQERTRLDNEAAQARVANYGNMLHAAKTFFKEGSTGWKIMEGAERIYRLFQFAMMAKAIVMDTIHTGTSVANSATRASASGVEAVAKAMASLPPPFNFIAAGAVVAFLVAMGVKMVGGGGKGKASAATASSSASKASDSYNGPRDEYGNPTSGYSVLRPGATTVANDNSQATWGDGGGAPAMAGSGGAFRGGDLIINGGADKRTVEEMHQTFEVWNKKTVEDARQAAAADRAASNSRQRIGGG